MPPEEHPLLFVYGTLKRGFGNHRVMLDAGGEFVCEGKTAERLPLIHRGLPYLLDQPGRGHQVEGEVFRVGTAAGWHRIDRLEGHPDFYCRRLTNILGDDGETYEAWTYFVARGEEFEGLPPLCVYGRAGGVRNPQVAYP
jgi:gamma-glutamylaminecyclotransferase